MGLWPVYAAGLAKLQGPDGNYWGHNAIIRIRAFHGTLRTADLPGPPPLGGEIMSHDFVEAALLRRAGWDVWLATDIGGSYEASPPTLIDYLKRDRRWCQGNLQHISLIFAQGLRLPSRLHFALRRHELSGRRRCGSSWSCCLPSTPCRSRK